jgi:hypothetical protein
MAMKMGYGVMPEKLALKLLVILFTPAESEDETALPQKTPGIVLLDQKKIHAIRCKRWY